jgi:hypothetical protein
MSQIIRAAHRGTPHVREQNQRLQRASSKHLLTYIRLTPNRLALVSVGRGMTPRDGMRRAKSPAARILPASWCR